jgi:hypothetical protein
MHWQISNSLTNPEAMHALEKIETLSEASR